MMECARASRVGGDDRSLSRIILRGDEALEGLLRAEVHFWSEGSPEYELLPSFLI